MQLLHFLDESPKHCVPVCGWKRHTLSDTAVAAQLLFVLALWAVYLGSELWKSQNERCTPGYFMAYGTQARHCTHA